MNQPRVRSTSLPLPPAEARCEPSDCVVRGRCARYLAAAPESATPIDFATEPGGGTLLCPGFVSAAALWAKPRERRGDAA